MVQKDELSKDQKVQLQSELGVGAEEYKKLKKQLEKLKGRDDRAMQTMLRVTSGNHYRLNQMVDRKAHIMIIVNSIILSFIVHKIIGDSMHDWKYLPLILMGVASMVSIILAILATQPEVKHGVFGEEEVANKTGNLLFFGNFLKLSERQYEDAISLMVGDRDYIYRSLARDIYYTGEVLRKKRIQLSLSLKVFMFGIVTVVVLSIALRFFIGRI